MRLASAHLLDGAKVDVDLDPTSGTIAAVAPAGSTSPPPGATVEPLDGYLLLPAPAEPHAHLDKALSDDAAVNETGDLAGAIVAWCAHRPSLTVENIAARARAAALMSVTAGATAIRSHVDVGTDIGLRAIEALVQVRAELAHLADIQLVALIGTPLCGDAGADHRALLRAAIDAGADLVGGAPFIDSDSRAATAVCVDAAVAAGAPLDLHTDETLDPTKLALVHLAEAVLAGVVPPGAAASHCVSLGVQPPEVQAQIAQLVAGAGIGVIANPQTNLYLQGREHRVSVPRGLTALRPLLDAGVTVAAGGDNVRDPFNPLGRGDPLEAASLLVSVGHLRVEEAWHAVGPAARAVMQLPEVRVESGYPAELLAIRAGSLTEALATATADRIVVHRGRVVARTRVETDIAVDRGPAGEGATADELRRARGVFTTPSPS